MQSRVSGAGRGKITSQESPRASRGQVRTRKGGAGRVVTQSIIAKMRGEMNNVPRNSALWISEKVSKVP